MIYRIRNRNKINAYKHQNCETEREGQTKMNNVLLHTILYSNKNHICPSVRPFLVTSLCCCWFLTGNKVWPCLKVTHAHTLRVVRWISITQKPLGFHNLVYFIRRIKITLIYLWLESSEYKKRLHFASSIISWRKTRSLCPNIQEQRKSTKCNR